ncbi:unnamed protein product [Calypogeia fissa]
MGAHDTLRFGIPTLTADALPAHPAQIIQETNRKYKAQKKRYVLEKAYGPAGPLQLQLEQQILSNFQRPPGLLPSSMLGVESLTDTLDETGLEGSIGEGVRSMEQMFPGLCPNLGAAYLRIFSAGSPTLEEALQWTVEHFLQAGFPKDPKARLSADGASTSNAASSRPANVPEQNPRVVEVVDLASSESDDSDTEESQLYQEWCIYRLSLDFPRIALHSLKTALRVFEGKLDPTYKAVKWQYQLASKKKGVETSEVLTIADEGLRDTSWLPRGKLKLLKAYRPPKQKPFTECPRFEREWKALQTEFQKLEGFDELSCDVGGEPVPPTGIECGCCYAEKQFEELVQCADGHLFCTDCLRRHLEGCIFGGSQACGLPKCLDTDGCDETIPWSEVKRALPVDVLSKYEQRQAEDAVARAQLQGLVYCPFCNHPWEVDPGMAVLRCHNEECKKASCIKCKEPDHLPQRCEEVEKKSETSLRRKVEELMTRALIRECTSCKAELVKIEGCNKITCRCGQTMCYVCRKPITSYSHFCQHVREPGKQCKMCPGCSLWERENEAAVVEAAKKAAIEEVGSQEPGLLKRDIGPSEVEKPENEGAGVEAAKKAAIEAVGSQEPGLLKKSDWPF